MTNLIQATAGNRPVFNLSGDDYGVEFNVSDNPQYLVAPVPTAMGGATAYTYAGWFYRAGNLDQFNGFPTLFGLTVDGGSATGSSGIQFSSGDVYVSPLGGSKGNFASVPIDPWFPENTWVHLAAHIITNTGSKFFVNGVERDVMTNGSAALPATFDNVSLSIGAARDGARPTPIRASNLQLWNIALTDQQVQDWAMPRLTGTLPSGLVGYWPL